MSEKIGKVTLDYEFYPGVDLYCDGDVEEELLQTAMNHQESEFNQIIDELAKWPFLYHLSEKRENIIEWLPITKDSKVLEVGSGCGAITGALAKKSYSVDCIDLSKKRSMINAYRHQEFDNIHIHVGNFKDIETTLAADYDYIFLIGVFEYAKGYMGTATPYEDFLNILKKHLKFEGRLVIAIENQWGLKYWSGCREDHLGTYFTGLEGYPEESGVRTFTRRGLEEICQQTDTSEYHFYYPYPDYKFMTTLFSDDRLPNVGELSTNLRNFDRDRMILFDEKHVYDNIIREKMFPVYSNSYLLLIGPDVSTQYVKYSNDRASEFSIKTEIVADSSAENGKIVRKMPLSMSAELHINKIEDAYHALLEAFQDSDIKINICNRSGSGLEFPYIPGITLEELLDLSLEKRDKEGFIQLLQKYTQVLNLNIASSLIDKDLIFSNILVNGTQWNVIDYEWSTVEALQSDYLFTRAIYCYSLGSHRRKLFLQGITDELVRFGYSTELKERVILDEVEFQKYVNGNSLSMVLLREKIGTQMIQPDCMNENKELKPMVQIYEDYGNGFSEEQSYFPDNFGDTPQIQAEIIWPAQCRKLRFDPCMHQVLIYVRELSILDGNESFSLTELAPDRRGRIRTDKNGFYTNAVSLANGFYAFKTEDPNITIQYRPKTGNTRLKLVMELCHLPEIME